MPRPPRLPSGARTGTADEKYDPQISPMTQIKKTRTEVRKPHNGKNSILFILICEIRVICG
jgi:hypothetical protein